MKLQIVKTYWLFPILYFLMVWLTMTDNTDGTDFANQIYSLEITQNVNLNFLLGSDFPFLYQLVYKYLYSLVGISPRFYIALLSFIYYCIIFYAMKKLANASEISKLNNKKLSLLVLFTCMCYSPSLICIARYHFAVILVVIGILIFQLNKKYIWRIFGILLAIIAYYAHEGIIIIYAILILAFILHRFCFSNILFKKLRTLIICSISLILFFIGPFLFSFITYSMSAEGLLSERYQESYAEASAGDGIYLLVLILCLFGSMLSLFITCLYDRKNNWITAICISGLFMTCLLFNQKFFLVQRVFMFMPLFIGLSCMQVLNNLKYGSKYNIFILALLSVPAIYLCQLIVQHELFFAF